MFENLQIDICNLNNISDEETKFINRISPSSLTFNSFEWSVENITAFTLLNCTNLDLKFSNKTMLNFHLLLINTPIKMFDSKSDQRTTIERESIKFFIDKSKLDKVKLFNSITGTFLFISFETIGRILFSGSREILSDDNINKQFDDLDAELQFYTNGFVIPMRYSNKIFVNFDDSNLNCLNQIIDINQIIKEKHIELVIKNLGRWLEINRLLPDDIYKVIFNYRNYPSEKFAECSIPEIMTNLDWTNLKFIQISKSSTLSPDEFRFWWMMLHFGKTRFYLTSINLKFDLLSECLTVLSLCSDCPELKYVELRYSEADAENEDKAVKHAKKEFRQKFGFIQKLDIFKNKER